RYAPAQGLFAAGARGAGNPHLRDSGRDQERAGTVFRASIQLIPARTTTSQELYGRVRTLAEQLFHWGIERGDRVALLSENRWEWAVTDFAVLALGAVDVPLYATLTADQIGYMLRDSGAKALILSSREQFEKLKQAGDLPDLRHVVLMDPAPSET